MCTRWGRSGDSVTRGCSCCVLVLRVPAASLSITVHTFADTMHMQLAGKHGKFMFMTILDGTDCYCALYAEPPAGAARLRAGSANGPALDNCGTYSSLL